jgi:hypothetical protein
MRCGQPAARVSVLDWFERAAAGASLLCLIHCAGLPLLLAAIPALSRALALPESFHLWMIVLAVPASGTALLAGYRQHRAWRPLATGIAGLGLLLAGALLFGEGRLETPVTIAGSLCLVAAHIANWRGRHGRHRHG